MGSITSGPRKPASQKRPTVESARRITPDEAAHVGAATVSTQIGNTAARRLWFVCPSCGARCGFLFRPASAERWACRKCHRLTYQAQQQHGTVSAFQQWATRERYEVFADQHPARAAFRAQLGAQLQELSAVDPDRCSPARRAELIAQYGTIEAARIAHDAARAELLGPALDAREAEVAQRIWADLRAAWMQANRSARRPKDADQHASSTEAGTGHSS